jgi:cyclophilin family peptidyl-prolyl cis-trans isomerase
MSCRGKIATGWLKLAVLMALAGCNRGGDTQSPNAALPTGGDGPALAKPTSDPLHPVVAIETSRGTFKVRLDAEKARQTVDNFLGYVQRGQYDQTIVHQVFKGQGFVGGGYGTDLIEKPSRTQIRNEADNGLRNRRGTIAMARLPDAIDSATRQFFVNVTDNPTLDFRDRSADGFGYCVFGEVIEDGLKVIEEIGNVPVRDTKEFERTPEQMIVVRSIKQVR